MEFQPVRTSIVIVTYNSMTTLERCVSSVLKETDDSAEIIVVDNASADDFRIECIWRAALY